MKSILHVFIKYHDRANTSYNSDNRLPLTTLFKFSKGLIVLNNIYFHEAFKDPSIYTI